MKPSKKKMIALTAALLLLLGGLTVGLLWREKTASAAVLTIEKPQKLSAS